MPNKPVTIRRWEVVAAFIFVVGAAAFSVQWSNHNLDRRIDRNAVSIEDLAQVNMRQNEIREELVHYFCDEINGIKERVRATVRVRPRALFAANVLQFNPNLTTAQIDALYRQAKEQEREVRERFAASDCAALPGG